MWEGQQALSLMELRLRHHCRQTANLTAQALLSAQRHADLEVWLNPKPHCVESWEPRGQSKVNARIAEGQTLWTQFTVPGEVSFLPPSASSWDAPISYRPHCEWGESGPLSAPGKMDFPQHSFSSPPSSQLLCLFSLPTLSWYPLLELQLPMMRVTGPPPNRATVA